MVATLAHQGLRHFGFDLAGLQLSEAYDPELAAAPVPDGHLNPSVLGEVYEALSSADARKGQGKHYTPAWLARGLTAMALGNATPKVVLDPSAGGGAFLLAAADELLDRGVEPSDVVGGLVAMDLDPWAVAVTEAALALWSHRRGVSTGPPLETIVGDALTIDWPQNVDMVLGNPPFLTPLRTATNRADSLAERFTDRIGFRPGPYADAASLFLARAVDAVDLGGKVALILPTSVSTARDSGAVRRFVDERATAVGVWVDDGSAFDAGVITFAPIFERGRTGGADSIQRIFGCGFGKPETARPPLQPDEWSTLLAPSSEGFDLETGTETLGDIAAVTAGFRDEFYAIAAAVVEAGGEPSSPERPKVITSGLIDVGINHWGNRVARIAKARWANPVASIAEIAESNQRVGAWCRARLIPKVLVATQTKVVEPTIDVVGDTLPITPVLSVEPRDAADLFAVAAVLMAPPVSRWLVERRRGSGMSRDAIRISAKDLASVPLPIDTEAWGEATAIIEANVKRLSEPQTAERIALVMTRAYRIEGDVVQWWLARAVSTT